MIRHNLYRSQTLRVFFMLAVFMLLSASQGLAQILGERFAGREYRAVWLTTLSGLDWPSRPVSVPSDTLRQQQALRQTLDRLQQAGINTVIFQTRIRATVAYPSNIEPWDGAFSGTPGRGPGYDPLAFALRECHKRGMELHAWVVAFPICNVTLARRLGAEALPKKHPELCHRCGDAWFMDPGVPATAQYIAGICREIVERYDVDGIHLDYIRYPEESVAWKDQATYRKYGNGKRLGDWRRENVSRVVQAVHDAVKSVRPWVKLSCSPVGKRADLPRQSSYGWNAREAVYQDAAQWLQQGQMDVLFPMMYFDGKHFYPFAQDWTEQSGGRPVVPGLGIYFLSPREKDWSLSVIARQMHFARQLNMGGTAFFRSKFLTDNTKGLYDFLQKDFYRQPVLTPPMKVSGVAAPEMPHVSIKREGNTLHLSWKAVTSAVPVIYNIYRISKSATSVSRVSPLAVGASRPPKDTLVLKKTLEEPRLVASKISATQWIYTPSLPSLCHDTYIVRAMDAYGQESGDADGVNVVAIQ